LLPAEDVFDSKDDVDWFMGFINKRSLSRLSPVFNVLLLPFERDRSWFLDLTVLSLLLGVTLANGAEFNEDTLPLTGTLAAPSDPLTAEGAF
jgi:hypothetical protein